MKYTIILVRFLGLAALLAYTQGCTQQERFYSTLEIKLLQDGNNPFDPNRSISGVDDSDDARVPNLMSSNVGLSPAWVRRCDGQRYDLERAAAIERARLDPDRRTIPVKFTISTGTVFDDMAHAAHRRSILRKDTNGETRIPVGPHNGFGPVAGPSAFHYVVNHMEARSRFMRGENCFFDTVTVERGVQDEIRMENGASNHNYRFLHYGELYSNPNAPEILDGGVSPRLFQRIENRDYSVHEPQVVPLFVADIREGSLRELGMNQLLLNPEFSQDRIRNRSYRMSYKEVFDLRNIWTYRDAITQVLSSERHLNFQGARVAASHSQARAYSAYEAVPQLVDWIVFSGLEATVMSTHYTPIVLDLGHKNIRTASVDWGTFFNLGGLKRMDHAQKGISHLTAWLGGYVANTYEANAVDPDFKKRMAEDGLLVVPNADGSVTGPHNLFGDGFKVSQEDGSAQTYENGFLALAAFAGKNCSSKKIQDRYVGPWDGALYSEVLKVWVDRNRNGMADAGEIASLKDSKVGALNTCYFVHAQDEDRFGNKTKYRAAFLMLEEGENPDELQNEIVSRLASGKRADGQDAHFRVMIDIFFKALPQVYLENVALDLVEFNDGTPVPPLNRAVAIGNR